MKIDCMKKTMVILAALTFGCAVAFAAPAPDSNSPAHRNGGRAAQRPAHNFLQELSEKLNLTDEQKAAIEPILATEANEIKAVHQDSSLSDEQKQAKVKEIRDSSREKINALLTPEQQKTFAEMKGEAGNRMREESQNRLAGAPFGGGQRGRRILRRRWQRLHDRAAQGSPRPGLVGAVWTAACLGGCAGQ